MGRRPWLELMDERWDKITNQPFIWVLIAMVQNVLCLQLLVLSKVRMSTTYARL